MVRSAMLSTSLTKSLRDFFRDLQRINALKIAHDDGATGASGTNCDVKYGLHSWTI